MKRLIASLMFVLSACVAFGQMKPPQQTDTLYIHSVKYNYADIRQENWPCEVIYKSTTSFRIGEDEFFIKSADKLGTEVTFYVSTYKDTKRYKLLYRESYDGDIKITFSGYEFTCGTSPHATPSITERMFASGMKRQTQLPNESVDEEEAIPFQLVDEKPSFQGGNANGFSNWVNQHLNYPDVAKENGVQGRVTLHFTIGSDGSVRNVRVLRGVDPALDSEAVRVVSMSPKWEPGKQRGKPVAVTYTFPVIFQTR